MLFSPADVPRRTTLTFFLVGREYKESTGWSEVPLDSLNDKLTAAGRAAFEAQRTEWIQLEIAVRKILGDTS